MIHNGLVRLFLRQADGFVNFNQFSNLFHLFR